MKCKSFYVFSLVLVLAIFSVFSSLYLSTTVSAIADWSITVDVNSNLSGFPEAGTFCHNTSSSLSGHACSDYNYLIFESSYNSSLCGNNFFIGFSAGGVSINLPGQSFFTVLEIKNYNRAGFYGATLSNGSSCLSTSDYYKFTLTESYSPGSPSGSITLTENGTFDVSSYAEAVVDVPPVIEQGDYHDDLVDIKMVILLVPAVMIMLYLFFSIYKMLFRRS